MLLSELAANEQADAVTRLLHGGTLVIYDAADTPLATLKFAGRAFAPAFGGVADAHPLTPDTSAEASGTAAGFSCFSAKGLLVLEGTAGGPGSELVLNAPEIRQGAEVSIEEFRFSVRR
jgi:hypothetical protein